jgi:hypothetical protein
VHTRLGSFLPPAACDFIVFFFFLVVLGFELGALCLLGRCFIT